MGLWDYYRIMGLLCQIMNQFLFDFSFLFVFFVVKFRFAKIGC